MTNRKEIGRKGEEAARKFLQQNGYKIVETNYENKQGELDIIAYDRSDDMLIFLEVRSGQSERFHAETSIGKQKKQKITNTAEQYLARQNALGTPHRYDVIGVTFQEDDTPDIRHHQSVFSRGI